MLEVRVSFPRIKWATSGSVARMDSFLSILLIFDESDEAVTFDENFDEAVTYEDFDEARLE